MATKKEKRIRALAKREEFLAKEKEAGLAAQQRSREEEVKKDELVKAALEKVDADFGMSNVVRNLLLVAAMDIHRSYKAPPSK